MRQGDRQREAGKARARSDVGDGRRASDERKLERRQAIGDVEVDGLLGVDHGRRRVALGGERSQQAPDLCACGTREGVALGQRLRFA